MEKLSFNNVSVYFVDKHHQETQVIHNLNMSLEEDKICVLLGYSGSGKTTLLNCISGRLVFDGEIIYKDRNITEISIQDRNIAYVNQNFVLYPHMTVYDNIASPLKSQKISHDERDQMVKEIADKLGILYLLTRKPKFLSIGQQQRVAIARALVKKPELILFDEPLSNLDKENRNQIREVIKEYIKTYHMTALYVTHNIEDAFKLADYVYVIHEGRIINKYLPNQLMDSKNEIVVSLLQEYKKDEEEI